jgi:hypothetical protein
MTAFAGIKAILSLFYNLFDKTEVTMGYEENFIMAFKLNISQASLL